MSEELTAAEANRRFYAQFARTYHATEECVVDERLQARLQQALARAVAALPAQPNVLDACGGSGNASLILHSLGVTPTTIDVSREMLLVYEETARARGLEPVTEVAEIEAYLEREDRQWDLIVFSSALHHLDNYERTLQFAAARLARGGMLMTIFDPTPARTLERRVRRLEYLVHVVIRMPQRLPVLVARRLARLARVRDTDGSELGERAELHALEGIDDFALRALFERLGLEIVAHERTYEGRFGVTRAVYRALDRPSSFHFLVRRP